MIVDIHNASRRTISVMSCVCVCDSVCVRAWAASEFKMACEFTLTCNRRDRGLRRERQRAGKLPTKTAMHVERLRVYSGWAAVHRPAATTFLLMIESIHVVNRQV